MNPFFKFEAPPILPVFRVVLPHAEPSDQRLFRRSIGEFSKCPMKLPYHRLIKRVYPPQTLIILFSWAAGAFFLQKAK